MVACPEGNSTSDWNHEAVADNADVLAIAQQLAQAAEEIGAVALQSPAPGGPAPTLRRAPDRRCVRLALLVLGLGRVECLLERRHLAAQRQQLLVEQVDLGHRLLLIAFVF